MKFLKSLLCLLGISRPPSPRPSALESSAFGKLSLDLIIHIARFLPPDAASSFTLSCRLIYFTLGNQHFKALEGKTRCDRVRFLTLLERDLPGHIICYQCNKLHAIDKAHRYYPSGKSNSRSDRDLRCCSLEHYFTMDLWFHYRFSSTVLAMTMKSHRLGRDCSKLLDLLSCAPKNLYAGSCLGECKISLAKIVEGSLLLREIRIYTTRSQLIPGPWDMAYLICPHIPKVPISYDGRCFRVNYAHFWQREMCHGLDGMVQCNRCYTEFRVEFKTIRGRHTAVFITIWKDLGQGRSPFDPVWQRHIRSIGYQSPIDFEPGSICAAFEQREHFEFEVDSILTGQIRKDLCRNSPL